MIDTKKSGTAKADPATTRRWMIWLTVAGFACLVGASIAYFFNFHQGISDSQAVWGAFGDFIGGVAGPLLSFVGLIALLLTINLQLAELRTNQEELSLSREALESQGHSLQVQLFENSFFSQVRLLNEIIAATDIMAGHENIKTGRDCYSHIAAQLRRRYSKHRADPKDTPLESTVAVYDQAYSEFETDLAHYLRTVYNLLRYVHEHAKTSPVPYIRIARAQLSDAELTLLFYNGLTDRGRKMKALIGMYAILDNLRDDQLHDKRVKSEYEPSAFSSDMAFAKLSVGSDA